MIDLSGLTEKIPELYQKVADLYKQTQSNQDILAFELDLSEKKIVGFSIFSKLNLYNMYKEYLVQGNYGICEIIQWSISKLGHLSQDERLIVINQLPAMDEEAFLKGNFDITPVDASFFQRYLINN
ncbi:MAG: hypothetical protein N5P05_002901 [Chroococcopsis gigantea SAG 12.99]|jgi:hypothetical protein|nr:hypothetical protein [Chlorogloea purpurea SAG 13.99]MDV3001295.1 hypothetical protein [Chroococcopsis gigantea SAG 12.99]